MTSPTLILIEFNELCPSLLDRFMSEGCLPNFRRFYETATVFTTDAQEKEPNLEPWIQWPTVHSGMTAAEHQVFHLGDGRKLDRPCIAEILSDAGVKVGVCGSMNLNYRTLNGYLLPDPWDKEGEAQPASLQPFYRTVARQVQESSRQAGPSRQETLAFAFCLLRNGLTLGTAQAIVQQLWAERRDPGLRWRRACLLDRLQYDVFRCLNRRLGVRFATFFCNSTAHFQHYYWRNMEPERFSVPPPEEDHPSLRDAIRAGYEAMDQLLGRFLQDYPQTQLWLCTALSQQPWVETTKCTFRPKRFETFLEFARVAVPATAVKPVMAEQFHVECPTLETAVATESRFRDLVVDGEPLLVVQREGANIFTGCRLTDGTVRQRPITRRSDGATAPFDDLFYMIHTMRSGRHHPDGVLWIRNGRHRVVEEQAPLTAIAPKILRQFGVAPPSHMHGTVLPDV